MNPAVEEKTTLGPAAQALIREILQEELPDQLPWTKG